MGFGREYGEMMSSDYGAFMGCGLRVGWRYSGVPMWRDFGGSGFLILDTHHSFPSGSNSTNYLMLEVSSVDAHKQASPD